MITIVLQVGLFRFLGEIESGLCSIIDLHAFILSALSCDAMYRVRESKSKLELFYCSNHKNYNFLDCDWFKKLLSIFPLIHLPSCYRTV